VALIGLRRPYWSATLQVLILILSGLSACGTAVPRATVASGPELVRAELAGYATKIASATAVRYGVSDDLGHSMDTVKIIEVPGGDFAGVFATWREDASVFDIHLATSTDLINWTWRTRLGSEASQPTIRASSDGGYVVAWEVTPLAFDAHSYPEFRYYASWEDLLAAKPSRTFVVQLTLSPCCEGTVNLYAASSTNVDAGFHYLADMVVDRQARATMDWTSWTAVRDLRLDTALTELGVKGNIGDRDTIRFRSIDYMLLEGQLVMDDIDSERIFLVDLASGTAQQLDFRTPDGSASVSNPTVELVHIGGQLALVFAAYVFSDTAQGGPMIWYRLVEGP
jgi:hypothetical protein